MDDVKCPICSTNLSLLPVIKRDEHCDKCLDNVEFLEPTKKPEVISEKPQEVPEFFRKRTVPAPQKPSKVAKVKSEPFLSPQVSNSTKIDKITKIDEKYEAITDEVVEKGSVIAANARGKRPMPFYKTLKFGSTTFAVDAFSYGAIPKVQSYFLTHFHSDHYGGLTKNWTHGPIYCTPATARLVNLKLKVPLEYLKPLEINKEYHIEGVEVKLFDANHCPGAAVIVFNKSVLHTGDFRATTELTRDILEYSPMLDTVYLDTTYLDPNRAFPDQDSVVSACADFCVNNQNKPMPPNYFTKQQEKRRILVCVGSYTIGKEKLAIAIANRLNKKIWSQSSKTAVLKAIDDPALNELLCDDGTEAQVHICSMRELNLNSLETRWKYLKKHFTHMIAFIPTGWNWKSNDSTFSLKTLEDTNCTKSYNNGMIKICSVPYSEHSSYTELEQFCSKVRCKELISTVYTRRYDILRSWESSGKTSY